LRLRWTSPIYAFYKPEVDIQTQKGRRTHAFTCTRPTCNHQVRRYVDKKDCSTSNLRKHALACWGEEAVTRAMEASDNKEAHKSVVESILKTGRISTYFARKKGAVSYSHIQHTREETRIVRDPGFITLMKMGRPGYYLPSPSTVSRDTKTLFASTRRRMARLLQEHKGKLSFATDAWTSPNHCGFVAITIHLEHEGRPLRLLLDIIEVPKVCILTFYCSSPRPLTTS
ncbi:hypothetical protein C8Q78DRAFT_985953, partial [Trametes maxima]